MQTSIVLTIIGPDRPGLVDTLATAVRSHGGNWLESRMCHLGGHFAGLLHINIPEDRSHCLQTALESLKDHGIQVIQHTDSLPPSTAEKSFHLNIIGNDRPGIIQEISSILAKHDANVEELSSECRSAPMSGEPIFEASISISLNPKHNFSALKQELETIAAELMVDVHFEKTSPPPAS